MGNNMARIEDGIVVNIEWFSSETVETENLKNMEDRQVEIGDTYQDGKFYRDGMEVLTPLEQAYKDVQELQDENDTLLSDMAQMVDEVYTSDMEMMGL